MSSFTPSLRLRTVVLTCLLAVVAALLGALSPAPAAATPSTGGKVTAWIPYWDQTRAMTSFSENADLYGSASPFWYLFTSTGTVSRYSGAEDESVLSTLRNAGVRVIPTITNDFDPVRVSTMLASSSARAAHVEALGDLVQAKGYDGIDVDYEALHAADRDRFSLFLSELSSALHAAGKVLTVAVHPKTSDTGTWNGPQAQDYAAIGAVADRVRVMAYDYSWSTSPAGPISPLSWVKDVAAYSVSRIPAAKIELGMNLYGYDWVGSRGEGVTFDTTQARRTSFGATRMWDATTAEPSFSYVSGGTTHVVHYADAQSVAARLAVVDSYGLGGAAFWRLGGEDAAVWTEVRSRWGSTAEPVPAADTVAPSVPSGVTATGFTRRATVSWAVATDTGGSGLAGYRLERAPAATGPWSTVATTTGTRVTDRGLTRGRTYWYAVRAVDGAGNVSAASAVVSVTAR